MPSCTIDGTVKKVGRPGETGYSVRSQRSSVFASRLCVDSRKLPRRVVQQSPRMVWRRGLSHGGSKEEDSKEEEGHLGWTTAGCRATSRNGTGSEPELSSQSGRRHVSRHRVAEAQSDRAQGATSRLDGGLPPHRAGAESCTLSPEDSGPAIGNAMRGRSHRCLLQDRAPPQFI